MKKILHLFICMAIYSIANAQIFPVEETIGTATPASVASYTGWSNNGMLGFAGTAMVDNQQPSNWQTTSSGGNNVLFDSVPGVFFEVTWNNVSTSPPNGNTIAPNVTFLMYNYDTLNYNELVLECSVNGGAYQTMPYHRMFGTFLPATPWDVMSGGISITLAVPVASLKYRFRQTTHTKRFRIDDIYYSATFLLPLHTLNFAGNVTNNGVALNWTANSTQSSENYTVERSTDGVVFSPINTQSAKGNGTYTYNYTDATAVAEKVFYRLLLKDASGKTSYSQILAITTNKKKVDLIEKLYPLPAKNNVTISLNSDTDDKVSIDLFDISGVKVSTQNYSLLKGVNALQLDISQLKAGNYVLKASTTTKSQSTLLTVVP